ncbi:hypothetical protein VTK26DRAFT_545 [Humicola hyalothermophila]
MSSQTPGVPPSAKRRRLEAANATLRKPFRSPLINRQQVRPGIGNSTPDSPSGNLNRDSGVAGAATAVTPATPVPVRGRTGLGHGPAAAAAAAAGNLRAMPSPLASPSLSIAGAAARLGPKSRSASASAPASALASRSINTARRAGDGAPTQPATPSSASTRHGTDKDGQDHGQGTAQQDRDADPLRLLQHMRASQRSLNAHLHRARRRLELVRQARLIETQSAAAKRGPREGEEVDAELTELTGKWKAASRAAADELFGLVRDRVEGMGGARAWRESERRRRRMEWGSWGDGDDDGRRGKRRRGVGEGVGDEDEDEDGLGDGDGDGDGEDDKEGGGEKEEGNEESGFTMLMMLKSLNIDPDVLGYDPVEERWKDDG